MAGRRTADGSRRRGLAFLSAALLLAAVVSGVVPVTSTPRALAVQTPASCNSTVALSNGGFERPTLNDNSNAFVPEAQVPGWRTTATDHVIEVWRSTYDGFSAATGSQFAELNANQASTLYQDLPTTPGQTLRWELAHRGRSGVDVMAVVLGAPGGLLVSQGDLRDDRTAWGRHSGTYVVPLGQTMTRFGFRAVSTARGNATVGNFLDGISFGTGACLVATESVAAPGGGTTANVGETLTYTVTATNGGGNPAKSTVLRDVLPAGVTFVPGSIRAITASTTSVRTDAAGDDAGEYDAASRTVTVRVGTGATAVSGGTVDPGDVRSFSYQVTVDRASASSTIVDDATAAFADDLSGRSLTATSNEVRTTIKAAADLGVTVAQASPSLVAGRAAEYTATLSSNGPGTEPAARLVASIPPLDAVAVTSPGGTCGVSGQTVTCDFGALVAGSSRALTVTGTVPATTAAGERYVFRAASAATVFDPVAGNNVSTTSADVATSADLSIALTSGPGRAGDPVTYTATVTNDGPSVARQVRLVDPLPADSTYLSSQPGGACVLDPATNTVTCPVGDLAPGASATVEIVARLSATGTGAVDNAVRVVAATPDPDATDNNASVQAAGTQRADLSVDLRLSVSQARPGESLGFTLDVSNAGPSAATNISFDAVMPAGFRVTAVSGATCATATSGCTIPSLASQATTTLTGTALVQADAPAGTATATATAISATPDDVPANDSDSVSLLVVLEADLAVAQVTESPLDPGGPIVAGGHARTRATVTNAGPTRAEGIVLRQDVPAGQWVPDVVPVGGRGSCRYEGTVSGGMSVAGAVVVCSLDTLALGQVWEVTFDTVVPASSQDDGFSRTFQLSATSPDLDPSDDTVTANRAQVRRSDIGVQVTTSTPRVVQTDQVLFQVVVTNDGPSDARDVLVGEVPRAGVVVVSASPGAGSYSDSTGAWRIPYLVAGRSVTLDVIGTAESSGVVVNEARFLSAEGQDPVPGNDAAAATVDVTPAVRSLTITTTAVVTPPADATAAVVGDTITYSYEVTNDGNVQMSDIAVDERRVGAAGCPQSVLAPMASMTCAALSAYRVSQEDFDAGQGISSAASAGGRAPGSALVLVFASPAATVPMATASPALRAVKVADWDDADHDDALDSGETIDWTVRVENTGDVTVTDVAVADPVAPGMSCRAQQLAPGAGTSCTAPTYTVSPADVSRGHKDNEASASAVDPRGGPPVLSAPTATRSPSAAAPALGITLVPVVAPGGWAGAADVGDTFRWGYRVTNLGNVTVTGVAVDDSDGGTVTCTSPVLEPGQTTGCEGDAVRTVGESEILARGVVNTAAATGVPVAGPSSVRSPDGRLTVAVAAARSSLTVTTRIENTSTADPRSPARRGDRLRMTYLVRNTGNITLASVRVDDLAVGTVSCADTSVAGAGSTACAADVLYAVTVSDVDRGGVHSSASAWGEPPPRSGASMANSSIRMMFPLAATSPPVDDPAPVPPGSIDPDPSATAPPADPARVVPGATPAVTSSRTPGGGALAVTGAEIGSQVGWGVLLLVAGAGLVGLSCRRVPLRSPRR